jgi:hypothetical protein
MGVESNGFGIVDRVNFCCNNGNNLRDDATKYLPMEGKDERQERFNDNRKKRSALRQKHCLSLEQNGRE